MQLPYQQTNNKDLTLLQNRWVPIINPVLANPIMQGQQLNGVLVNNGANSINHGLQRKLQGYIIVGKSADINVWDSQATNQTPALTLLLEANGSATLNLWVY